jgi:hypothetical protein
MSDRAHVMSDRAHVMRDRAEPPISWLESDWR